MKKILNPYDMNIIQSISANKANALGRQKATLLRRSAFLTPVI